MSGVEGVEGIAAFAAFLRELGPRLVTEGCKEAALALAPVTEAQWSEGKGPDDKAWVPRKADGAVAIRRLTSEVKWSARRGAIVATGDDIILHHRGKRPAFPFNARKLSASWSAAVEAALLRVAEKALAKVAR
jgi:hypothetical protein